MKILKSRFKLMGLGEIKNFKETFSTKFCGQLPDPLSILAIVREPHFSLNRLTQMIGLVSCRVLWVKNNPTAYILFCVSGSDVLCISPVLIKICLAP